MKSKMKKTISVTLACCCGVLLFACNNTDKDLADSSVLNICMPDLGYGTDWMYSVADGYTEKYGTKVNIDVTPNEAGYLSVICSFADGTIFVSGQNLIFGHKSQ